MKRYLISLVSCACVMGMLALPQTSSAQAPLIFGTTFDHVNCPDTHGRTGVNWEISDYFQDFQTNNQPCNGTQGIGPNLNIYASPGGPNQATGDDSILTAANNPGGGGGKGFRHWVGDGLNNNGGGIGIQWPSTAEMWFRYYVRFQAGFAWIQPNTIINMKMIYVQQSQSNGFYFGLHDQFIGAVINGTQLLHSKVRWSDWMGGLVGDGQWHCLEMHVKMNSPAGASNGIFEFWLNDVLIFSNTALQISNTGGQQYSEAQVGSNQNQPANGGARSVDYDDIAVSNTGRITCTAGVPVVRPPAPQGLTVQ
jgi:hypothetical protein